LAARRFGVAQRQKGVADAMIEADIDTEKNQKKWKLLTGKTRRLN